MPKHGTVDHTQYNTSVLRFITHKGNLPVLPSVVARDKALVRHGHPPMGELTNALELRDGQCDERWPDECQRWW